MKTKLNEKTFRAVKLMTAGGANIAEIAECFAISSSTVSRIRTSESYEDYCSLRAAEYDQRKQERAEKARKVAGQAAATVAVPQACAAPQARAFAVSQLQQPVQPQTYGASQTQQSQAYAAPQPAQPTQPQVVEHRQTVTIQATHYMMQEMKKTNELLELISRKLTFIVDQLN